MKNTGILLLFLLPVFGLSQNLATVTSENYAWKDPDKKTGKNLLATTLFSGSNSDLAFLQMDACSLLPSKKETSLQVPADEEYLLIIKSGTIKLSFPDTNEEIGRGSVSLLVPGQKFNIQTSGKQACQFFLMKYRSKYPANKDAAQTRTSFVTNWNKLEFMPHDKGGVRKYFETPTAMFKRLEMHVTTLNGGLKSHEPHTHRAAEIILVLDDEPGQKSATQMLIGDRSYQAAAGDLYYIGSNLLHGIRNIGTTPCSYFAFQFE